MVISGYPDAYFTGFQTFYMRFGWYQNQVSNAGRWMWNDNIFELEESEADFVINTDTGKIHIGSGSWTVLPEADTAAYLPNSQWLSSVSVDDTSSINIVRVNSQDEIEFGANVSGSNAYFSGSVYADSFIGDITASYAINSDTASYIDFSNVDGLESFSASIDSRLEQITASNVYISQSGQNVTLGETTLLGDLTVAGNIVAESFTTTFVTTSILYQSGSTKFGDTLDDTHQFTGSVDITGSVTASAFFGDGTNITGVISSSYSVNSETSSYSENSLTASYVATSSWSENSVSASYLEGFTEFSSSVSSSLYEIETTADYAYHSTLNIDQQQLITVEF